MTFVVIGFVAILVLLIIMRHRSIASSMGSGFRPMRDRRSGEDRRVRNVKVPVDRRRSHRRMEDAAANFLNNIETTGAA
jgi:hypothetical protein